MIKQLLLPFLGVIAFIVLVGLLLQHSETLVPTLKTVTIDSHVINTEIASTEASREQGLSGRTSLATDGGMLFVFGSKQINPTFWMKGMLIPLDFIWISGAKVVQIDKNVPIPSANTPDSNLKLYTARHPIDYVLEVNAGFSQNNSVKVGDSVTFTGI
jgi:uncharacterized membrane protein (UPF0127 family)